MNHEDIEIKIMINVPELKLLAGYYRRSEDQFARVRDYQKAMNAKDKFQMMQQLAKEKFNFEIKDNEEPTPR